MQDADRKEGVLHFQSIMSGAMKRLALAFFTSFLLSLAYGATLYVNSSFLDGFYHEKYLGPLYLAAAGLNLAFFFAAPKLLRLARKETLLIVFLLATGLGTLGMGLASGWLVAGASFVLAGSCLLMAYYFLDIAIEELSSDKHTGAIRGLYFTFINGGIALGPLMVSLIVKGDALRPIFYVSSLILLIALVSAFLQRLEPAYSIHPKYHQSLKLPIRAWWRMRNIRAVTLTRLMLEIFFALMVIYVPIYLHDKIGFAWSELGLIFTVMLIPFVVLEWPAGEAADRWWGEKEIMSVGFFLMGSMTLIMPFLGHSFAYWLVVLLVSRVGASLVEITTESYFFKKISAEDVGTLSIFRLTRPVSLILGTVLAAAIMPFYSYLGIFVIIAALVFWGMIEALFLHDTK